MAAVGGTLESVRPIAEIATRAAELGHVPDIEVRGPWPEHGDIHPKYYCSCSCGWKFKAVVRSEKNAMRWVVAHISVAVGENDGLVRKGFTSEMQKNGLASPYPG